MSLAMTHAHETPEADELARGILLHADKIRFTNQGFLVDVGITTSQYGDDNREKYRILSKGSENTVVMILEPASGRCQITL